MNKTNAYILLFVFVILTIPFFFISLPYLIFLYNGLVKKRNKVEQSFSGVDVALQKRGELIPNLVESVKEQMDFEQSTLNKIVELRTTLANVDPNSEERFKMENDLTGLLKNVMINVENYPNLRSNENMLQLQRSLNEVEEQISASRRAHNGSVNYLNNAIQTFPSNVLASINNYSLGTYFKADESLRATPNVKKLFNQ